MTLMMDMMSEILSIEKCGVVVRHKATRTMFIRRFAIHPVQEHDSLAILPIREIASSATC